MNPLVVQAVLLAAFELHAHNDTDLPDYEVSEPCSGGIPVAEINEILDVHNALRQAISNGSFIAKDKHMPAAAVPILDLFYNCDLEKSAQAVSDTCVFAHSKNRTNTGENLYTIRSSRNITIKGQGKRAAEAWVQEFQTFGWPTIKFTREIAKNQSIGHATQMAWAETTMIGCGMSVCASGKQVIVACHYRDAGNVINYNAYEPEDEAANLLVSL